jgi:nucleoside phosphorylase
MQNKAEVCVLISAGAEWRALLPHVPPVDIASTPYGTTFEVGMDGYIVRFLHEGWGKVAAAGSTQYAIDQWQPDRIINIGTCGGFEGHIKQGEVILAKKTIIYDIFEAMTDAEAAVAKYAVEFDLSWLPSPPPQPVRVETLLSADRDIKPEDIPWLIEKYDTVAADWESGAIAWIAKRNHVPCLILRAVSDLVGPTTSNAYADYSYFEEQCSEIMEIFALHLPEWIEAFTPN